MRKILAAITILVLLVIFVLVGSAAKNRKTTIITKTILLTVDTKETDLAFVTIADEATNEIVNFCIYVRDDGVKFINPLLMK